MILLSGSLCTKQDARILEVQSQGREDQRIFSRVSFLNFPQYYFPTYQIFWVDYCVRAKQILKAKGVTEIEEIRIDTLPEAREHMMNITGRRTVPQIFIGETHVGGCDELMALDAKGGLVPLLQSV